MKRFFELVIAAVILMWGVEASAQSKVDISNRVTVSAENITIEEQSKSQDSAQVVINIEIESSGASLKILNGRVRVSYKGRNVAILSLDDKVKISNRQNQKIKLPLRISFLHNSTTMAFKSAFKRGDVSDMKIDWSFDIKGGLKRYTVEQAPLSLSEVITAEQIEAISRAFK